MNRLYVTPDMSLQFSMVNNSSHLFQTKHYIKGHELETVVKVVAAAAAPSVIINRKQATLQSRDAIGF